MQLKMVGPKELPREAPAETPDLRLINGNHPPCFPIVICDFSFTKRCQGAVGGTGLCASFLRPTHHNGIVWAALNQPLYLSECGRGALALFSTCIGTFH